MPSALFSDDRVVRVLVFLLAGAFYLLVFALGRLLKRRAGIQLSWTYHVVAVAGSLLAAAGLCHEHLPDARELALVALVFAGFPLNAVLYRFVWPIYGYPGENARIPGFLPQVVAILLFLGLSFFALGALYHVTVTGLLTGSGVIAIIIGLALQDTLGNLFAGFGLQAGRAFRVGDWLVLQGQRVQVVEITWRSTRFRNNDDVSFNVPNNQLAKETIVNLYYPTNIHAMRVRVGVDYTVPPNEVKNALIACATAVSGVLADPAPRVFLTSFDDSSVAYELKFWIDDGRAYPQIVDAIRTRCWYEFARRQINFAFPVRVFERGKPRARDHAGSLMELLAAQPLFGALSPEQLELLSKEAKWMRFGQQETIIQRGAPGDSMFILAAGMAEVLSEREGRELRVGTLHAGECFGEISFLTGEPRSATVRARQDCEVVEIPKHAMSLLLRQQPSLAEQLSDTLTARRSATQQRLAQAARNVHAGAEAAEKEGLLRRLRAFFEL
ncbi:MAG: mechanosensitive ion channel [Verrucomicrobia bacterium]|nr:mechanosensitive ion channel [Verrucomicrobiota bacterium]